MTRIDATAISPLALLACLGLGSALTVLPAEARGREPAPIIYAREAPPQARDTAGQGAGRPASSTQAGHAQPAAPQPGKRIEFRYPDHPNTRPGAEDPQPAGTDTQQFAHVGTPRAGREAASFDPTLSTAGFDPRATAARIAAQAAPTAQTRQEAAAAPQPDSYSLPGEPLRLQPVKAGAERGLAALYDDAFQGQPTANGETFDQAGLSAAHPSLPLPSLAQVTHVGTGREVVVRVNDRGPFVEGRLIDVSRRAGELLGIPDGQTAEVRVRYLGPAPVAAPSDAVEPQRRTVAAEVPSASVPRVEIAGLAAPSPAAPPLPPLPVSGEGDFYVQLGAFSNISNAERLTRSLEAGLAVDIVPARVAGADFFRVWVGPYTSRSEAERTRAELALRGVADGMVVSRTG